MKYYYGILIFLCAFVGMANAAPTDTSGIDKLFANFFDIAQSDPARGIGIARENLAASRSIGYKRGIVRAYQSLGDAYQYSGNIKNALVYFDSALKLSREYNLPISECAVLSSQAIMYMNIGDLDRSFADFNRALEIARAAKDKRAIIRIVSNIARLLAEQKKPAEANRYCFEALSLLPEFMDTLQETIILSAIGNNYTDMGKYKEAYTYLMRSMNLAKNFQSYGNLAYYYDQLGNTDSALYYYNIAKDAVYRDSIVSYYALVLNSIGTCLVTKGDYNKAEQILKQAASTARNIHDNESLQKASEYLAIVYEKKGDYKQAYQYHIEYEKLKDSLQNLEKLKKFEELNAIYDVRETEAKNEALEEKANLQQATIQRKNVLLYGSISAIIGLLLIGTLLMRQNKLKVSQQRIELEQKQLRAQMNPHFIFNCLNSIQHFVVANDVKNANKYLSGFALLMRQTLENSKEGTITLRKEIAYLENYLALELMRFEDKFTYELTCASDVSIDTVEVPAMIIQPFIENAIRHGLCFLTGRQGRLSIRFYMKEDHLCCEIDDNGIGRDESQKLKIASEVVYESQGMALTKQRLALVSKSSGSAYQIEIIDKKNGRNEAIGTTILIKFPANT